VRGEKKSWISFFLFLLRFWSILPSPPFFFLPPYHLDEQAFFPFSHLKKEAGLCSAMFPSFPPSLVSPPLFFSSLALHVGRHQSDIAENELNELSERIDVSGRLSPPFLFPLPLFPCKGVQVRRPPPLPLFFFPVADPSPPLFFSSRNIRLFYRSRLSIDFFFPPPPSPLPLKKRVSFFFPPPPPSPRERQLRNLLSFFPLFSLPNIRFFFFLFTDPPIEPLEAHGDNRFFPPPSPSIFSVFIFFFLFPFLFFLRPPFFLVKTPRAEKFFQFPFFPPRGTTPFPFPPPPFLPI